MRSLNRSHRKDGQERPKTLLAASRHRHFMIQAVSHGSNSYPRGPLLLPFLHTCSNHIATENGPIHQEDFSSDKPLSLTVVM